MPYINSVCVCCVCVSLSLSAYKLTSSSMQLQTLCGSLPSSVSQFPFAGKRTCGGSRDTKPIKKEAFRRWSSNPRPISLAPTMSVSARSLQDPRIQGIKTRIRVVPDFPKPGIMFQDITTLCLDTRAFRDTVDLFVERYSGQGISVVAGIEARGFIFGPPIALAIGAKFVPLRKPRKLPGPVISEEYILEYGTDCIQMHIGAVEPGERALVVDDLIATGGTLSAAMNLLERAGAEVVECACVIELPDLKGREHLKGKPLFVLVETH